MNEHIDMLAVLRQMQANSSHFRNGLPALADHHEGEYERELVAIAEVEVLIFERNRLQARLDTNRCNSGHETLPLTLWDCPECHAITKRERDHLREALESIRQYGSDTLSGRVDGPNDRDWQRESVREMTKRARLALERKRS